MMGLILIGVGLAVPDLPTAVAAALVFGTFVNPLLFVPLAFDPEVEKRLWYRALAVVSFLGVSGGLVVAAVVGPGTSIAADAAMPTTKPKLLLPVLALAALLALPATAQATLSYVTLPSTPTVFVANDNGSGARKVATGHNPHVAPDGLSVAYLHEGPKNAQELKLAPATGGAGKTLMTNLQRSLLRRLVARLEDDRGAARPRTRQAQAGPDRRRDRAAERRRPGLLQRLQLLAGRDRNRLRGGAEAKSTRRAATSSASRCRSRRGQRAGAGSGPPDQGPQLLAAALGPAEDRLRQNRRRQEAQVRAARTSSS